MYSLLERCWMRLWSRWWYYAQRCSSPTIYITGDVLQAFVVAYMQLCWYLTIYTTFSVPVAQVSDAALCYVYSRTWHMRSPRVLCEQCVPAVKRVEIMCDSVWCKSRFCMSIVQSAKYLRYVYTISNSARCVYGVHPLFSCAITVCVRLVYNVAWYTT